MLTVSYGIGYRIPRPVANLINFFLAKFRSKPIANGDDLKKTSTPFDELVYDPDTAICKAHN